MNDTESRKYEGTKWVSPACIRDIFLHEEEKHKEEVIENFKKLEHSREDNCREYLVIHPNMTEIKLKNRLKGTRSGGKIGIKQKITEFSRKSRRNFIKLLCKLDKHEPIELWQDFTFADDVMAGNTIEQRRDISNDTLNRFRRILKEKHPDLWAVYKREWEPRKSGNLSGEYIPHFHMFIAVRNRPANCDYISLALDLALIWVQCTQTSEFEKALRVARHPKSYRLIENQKHAMKYASKYFAKPDEFKTEEGIGRSWGTIGEIRKGNPEIISVTPSEAAKVKRLLRQLVNKKNKRLKESLSRPEIATFVIIQEDTMDRLLKYTGDILEWECRSFFAEVV